MSWISERLFKELPSSFDRDPRAIPGFALNYDGQAWVTISQRELRVFTTGGTGGDFVLTLDNKSLAQVVAELNAQPGCTASLLVAESTLSALSLVEVERQSLAVDAQFACFTSLLWRVLMPLVWALHDGVVFQERAALQSASIWSAEVAWLQYWGELYGQAQRKLAETDAVFAARIIHEVIRPKLNGLALEQIIEEDLGVQARIRHLYLEAWEVGTTRKGRIAGRKYSRTTFEVLVSDLVEGVRVVVDRTRAAGTLPYYRFQLSQGAVEEGESTVTPFLVAPQTLLSRHAWVVGRDTCGELPIGGKPLSLFELIGFAPRMESYLDVSAGLAGDPLVLGTGALGTHTLGDVTNAGVLVSEGAVQFILVGTTTVVFQDQVTSSFYRLSFGEIMSMLPVGGGPGESGWIIQSGWYLGIWNGVLVITETPIPGAVAKDGAVNLAVVNGVLVYTPPA